MIKLTSIYGLGIEFELDFIDCPIERRDEKVENYKVKLINNIPIFLFHFQQFIFDDLHSEVFFVKNIF